MKDEDYNSSLSSGEREASRVHSSKKDVLAEEEKAPVVDSSDYS